MRISFRAALSAVAGFVLVATSALAGGSTASASGTHLTAHKASSSIARVTISTPSYEILAGDYASVTIKATTASKKARSVRVTAVSGSAKSGIDFPPFSQRVAIPINKKSVTVNIPTWMRGFDVPRSSFVVKLSSPSSLLKLGSRIATRITLIPFDIPPLDQGSVLTLHDFESGVPGEYSSFATGAGFPPPLATVADGENHALEAGVGPTPAGSTVGFEADLEPTDRQAWTGFSIAFFGTGSGKSFAISLANGSNVFEQSVTDNSTGWRVIRLRFDELRLKGDPSNPARYDRTVFDGFSVDLTGLGQGNWRFDEASVYDVGLSGLIAPADAA